jgi:hypothetical protein
VLASQPTNLDTARPAPHAARGGLALFDADADVPLVGDAFTPPNLTCLIGAPFPSSNTYLTTAWLPLLFDTSSICKWRTRLLLSISATDFSRAALPARAIGSGRLRSLHSVASAMRRSGGGAARQQ